MNTKKQIFFILGLSVVLVIFFQALRSDYILGLFKNTNANLDPSAYDSAEIPKNTQFESYLIIYDKDEKNSIDIKDNISKTLEYMKKSFVVKEIGETMDYEDSSAVIITFEEIDKISNLQILMDYISKGGSLLFAERPMEGTAFSKISSIIGIQNSKGFKEVGGMTLLSNVLIKGTGLSVYDDYMANSSLDVELNHDSEIMAEAEDETPLIWSVSYEQGNIIMFNGTSLNEIYSRGLITGVVSLLFDDYIYPITNIKVIFIDDFPAPVPEGNNEIIFNEYGVSIKQFFREIWWPDIIKGMKKYDVKYTGALIETYEDTTTEPFESKSEYNKLSILYGRELLNNGGEISIHGYNHQSLAPKDYIKQDLGYNPWASIFDMEASLKEVLRYATEAFPGYKFRTYVPPSNILSSEGKQALKNALPDLQIISSVNNVGSAGDSYAQEFEVNDGIIEMPRLTEGYYSDNDTIWDAYNGITSIGVFSHFIHPDDVMDVDRSEGENWEELLAHYNELLSNIQTNFPWLEAVTSTEAASKLVDYLKLETFIQYSENKIDVYCKEFKEGDKFIVRSTGELKTSEDFTSEKIDKNIYIITAKSPRFTIELSR